MFRNFYECLPQGIVDMIQFDKDIVGKVQVKN